MLYFHASKSHIKTYFKIECILANDPEFDLEAALDDFVTFFGAGQETTAATMAFMLMECGRRPDIMEKYLC